MSVEKFIAVTEKAVAIANQEIGRIGCSSTLAAKRDSFNARICWGERFIVLPPESIPVVLAQIPNNSEAQDVWESLVRHIEEIREKRSIGLT